MPQRVDALILGLGNPGSRYAATKHNVGAMAAEDLALAHGEITCPLAGIPGHGSVIEVEGRTIAVVLPTTYMNASGDVLAALSAADHLPPERIIVIHDELDLPVGAVRIKQGGNENGHKGLLSLTEALGTRDYTRVRIGVGRPPADNPISIPVWVLSPIDTGAAMESAITRAAHGAWLSATSSVTAAQNAINRR